MFYLISLYQHDTIFFMQVPEMSSKRTRAPSDKESAATRFLDEFGGKPDEFYAFLGVKES
jgi:hypothetical protein